LWQMPHASTLMRTCHMPGSGISRSTSSQSPPGLVICAAFIFLPIKNLPLCINECCCARFSHCSGNNECLPHLENDFQLDRRAERKACDAIHQTARAFVFSENVLQATPKRRNSNLSPITK